MATSFTNVIRFAVGTPERHSSQWRVWINNNDKSDIYVATRRNGGTAKVSLHESGDWHYAFDANFYVTEYAQKIIQGRSRKIAQWCRPSPNEHDFTEALAILIPESSVVTVPYALRDSEAHRMHWIPAPEGGELIQVTLLLTSRRLSEDSWPGRRAMNSQLIGSIALPSGETLWVVHHTGAITPTLQANIDRLEECLDANGFTTQDDAIFRAYGFGSEASGMKWILDCL